MNSSDFSTVRRALGKTQSELARLLCVSLKAIQSFEQGWRNVPVSTERQLLFLLALKECSDRDTDPCWENQHCPLKQKENCPAWEFRAGNFCWFINGTICQGERQESWEDKIKLCRECEVYRTIFPSIVV